jgi:PAS domain S-box-containing protein
VGRLPSRLAAVEARVSEQAAFTDAVIDHMVVGLVIVTQAADVVRLNPAAEKLFGHPTEALVGRPLGLILPAFAAATPDQVLAGNHILSVGGVIESEGLRRSGDTFPVEISLYGFPTSSGRRYAVSARDVSERRTLDRLKRDFVSMVSHELRTPLTSIHGSLRLLAAGALGPLHGDADRAIQIAERNTGRLLTLINDILDIERLAAGESLRLSPLPIAGVIRQAIESLDHYAGEQGVTLAPRALAGDVLGNADRLVQVLVNLLANAIRFSPPGGVVRVSSVDQFGWVEVAVSDHGPGIPRPQQDRIFEPFHQIDSSDARARGGSGLGLAIARRIVLRHGGEIGVESDEGRGSTFWFRLPSVPAEPRATQPARTSAATAERR